MSLDSNADSLFGDGKVFFNIQSLDCRLLLLFINYIQF